MAGLSIVEFTVPCLAGLPDHVTSMGSSARPRQAWRPVGPCDADRGVSPRPHARKMKVAGSIHGETHSPGWAARRRATALIVTLPNASGDVTWGRFVTCRGLTFYRASAGYKPAPQARLRRRRLNRSRWVSCLDPPYKSPRLSNSTQNAHVPSSTYPDFAAGQHGPTSHLRPCRRTTTTAIVLIALGAVHILPEGDAGPRPFSTMQRVKPRQPAGCKNDADAPAAYARLSRNGPKARNQ